MVFTVAISARSRCPISLSVGIATRPERPAYICCSVEFSATPPSQIVIRLLSLYDLVSDGLLLMLHQVLVALDAFAREDERNRQSMDAAIGIVSRSDEGSSCNANAIVSDCSSQ
eukprot:3559284-Pleurochrysis_carterae.AAC.1